MSLRRITDTDTPEVVISDDVVVYERTDAAPLNWNTGTPVTAEKQIRVCNSTQAPFDLNMPLSSQAFFGAAGGVTQVLTVPAFGSITLMYDGQFPWFTMATG